MAQALIVNLLPLADSLVVLALAVSVTLLSNVFALPHLLIMARLADPSAMIGFFHGADEATLMIFLFLEEAVFAYAAFAFKFLDAVWFTYHAGRLL